MSRIRWRSVLRHFLQVVAFCLVVATLTTLVWPSRGYLIQAASALSVGLVTWVVIEFGRYLMVDPQASGDGSDWPGGWRRIALSAVGIAIGFVVGDRISSLFWGGSVMISSSRDNALSLLITLLSGTAAVFYFHSRGERAELAAKFSAAERDASEARLKLLETQLEPHMLFNTLANLRALISLDPPRAVEMLDHLNNYLRVTLAGSRAVAHPLAAEFDRLRDYLELMSIRMGPRLRYRLELPDDLRAVPVPPLLLQPLVENSIRHGLEPKVEGGEIVVRAQREADGADGSRIAIEVVDTGVGLGSAEPPGPTVASTMAGGGFGVTQVRERLATAYGARAGLELRGAAAGGGTHATVILPC